MLLLEREEASFLSSALHSPFTPPSEPTGQWWTFIAQREWWEEGANGLMRRKDGLATTGLRAERTRVARPTQISLLVVCEDVTKPEKPERKTVATLFCWTEAQCFGPLNSARWHRAGPCASCSRWKNGEECAWEQAGLDPSVCGISACFFNFWGSLSEALSPETTAAQDVLCPLKEHTLWLNAICLCAFKAIADFPL